MTNRFEVMELVCRAHRKRSELREATPAMIIHTDVLDKAYVTLNIMIEEMDDSAPNTVWLPRVLIVTVCVLGGAVLLIVIARRLTSPVRMSTAQAPRLTSTPAVTAT